MPPYYVTPLSYGVGKESKMKKKEEKELLEALAFSEKLMEKILCYLKRRESEPSGIEFTTKTYKNFNKTP